MSSAAPAPWIPPDLRISTAGDGVAVIAVVGAWNLRSLQPVFKEMSARLAAQSPDARWDLQGLTRLDRTGALMLWRAWGRRRAANLAVLPEHESLFAGFDAAREGVQPPRFDPAFLLLGVGRALFRLTDHLAHALRLLGLVANDALHLARNPARMPWREISASIYRTGAQALGITALVGFLVGVVLSYLTAQQLRQFGADIFIINLLGVSVIRELGPVLAAILIAGRSGSAMTAQLGVMRVTEELDAMEVMGIPQTQRLVLPKMLALAIAMPLIILWTDAIALIGGMVSAHAQLGISYSFFLSGLKEAVPLSNLWLGLGKGVVFGLLIALVACHFGLRIEPNTESLGQGTTNSVVSSITVVIIVDAIFAIMFSDVGSFG